MTLIVKPEAGPSFKVARATLSDRAAIAEMYAEFEPKGAALGLPPRKNADTWLASLSEFPNFIIKAADRVIAHAVLCIEGDAGETAVFVHQNWRSHGVGKLLLQELIAEGRRLGLRRVWGMAAPDNFVMLRLADSLGFVPGSDPGVFHLDLSGENPAADPPAASAA
jgi:L-amino acid N-acyltransferase YncA